MRRPNPWMPKSLRFKPLQVQELEDRTTPASLTVNSALDVVTPDAVLTLREAINTVNSQSTALLSAAEKALVTGTLGSADTISFASGLNGSTITLNGTSRLSIQRSVAITGPGANLITINGGSTDSTTGTQIFFIDGRTIAGNTTTISGLSLTNANARSGTGTTTGGVDNSIRGGALFNDSANFTLSNCYVFANTASFGGAIHGISGTTRLDNSTLSQNSGSTNGGAVTNGTGHTTFINQCTIVANTSGGYTGAVTNAGTLVSIAQSTITSNTTINSSVVVDAAAGIYTNAGSSTELRNTIVADNYVFNPGAESDLNSFDFSNAVSVTTAKSFNNYIGSNGSGGLVNGTNGNIVTINGDPLLTPLQDNGGTMPTRVPLAGSPVIGKGQNFNQPFNTDQRGYNRFAKDDGTTGTGAVIDIGATEFIIPPVAPINYVVSNTNDSGSGSLRQAVLDANAHTGATDKIYFTFSTPQTITLTSGELAISESVTFTGVQPNDFPVHVTIDAGGKSRIFNTDTAPAGSVITFNNLTLTGGSSDAGGGGAVSIGDETVNFSDCTLTGNRNLTLLGSTGGGAIAVNSGGTLNLTRTTISGNTATDVGGGITFPAGGSATILDSAIINNSSTNSTGGGGILFNGGLQSGGLIIRNTTISGNSTSIGGGIALFNVVGTALFQNSTIVNNTASNGSGGIYRAGAGNGIIDLQSTIVSGNVNATTPDISSNTSVNATNSAIGSTTGFTFGTNTNNLIGQNLLLGPLANNGGPTLSHALGAGSPAINAGDPATTTADARGFAVNGIRDIGAYEVQPVTILPATLPGASLSVAYSQTVSATAATLPVGTTFTYAVTAGTLPPNLTLAPNGTLSGTPTGTGTSNFTVTATASTGDSSSKAYSISVIANNPPTITPLTNRLCFGAAVTQGMTLSDDITPTTNLSLSAASSNLTLVPLANITFGGSGANRTVTVTPAGGKIGTATITVTVTDGNNATAQSQFVVTVKTLLENEFSIGRDRTGQSSVTLRNDAGSVLHTLTPFGTSFTGGIRTASGDVTGDGVADLIVASGPGMAGTVKVFDGVTQAAIALPETVGGGGTPFGNTFTKGIIVAAGDLNADGLSDLIITAEAGGGARVRIFTSTGNGFVQRSDFIALIGGDNKADGNFRGGSRATVSDINGDGTNDLIWAAGAGGGPRIATFNGALLNNGSNAAFKLSGDFFALATTLRDGAYLGGGDIDGDGIGDVVFGGGSGAPPQVVGYSGTTITQNKFTRFLDFNFGTNSGQGIRVAVKDLNNDNIADVIVGSAPGAGSRVAAFNGNNLRGSTTGTAIFDFTAFSGFTGGVFVG